jgi:Na+/H+ antiporter NhaD/arsenite permease-like protein
VLRFVRAHALVAGTAFIALAFVVSGRVSLETAARSIDYDLLLVLFALLVTVEMLRFSGALDRLVAATVSRFHRTRSLAAILVTMAGGLACLVTNDVALFVIIPFTVIASRLTSFDAEDVVVLEIVATNLIGCLTPLGNPQNLFVYHASGWSPGQFIAALLPFVIWNAMGLLIAIFVIVRPRRIDLAVTELRPLHRTAAIAGAVSFVLVVLEIAHVLDAWVAASCAATAGVIVLRRRLFATDLSIVPLFFFAFVIVAGLQTFPAAAIAEGRTYGAAIAISQVISNVPATVLLAPYAAGDWRELLLGVSVGGCGTIIASLANLLGWRIYVRESNRDPRFFRRLTVINIVFLVWAAGGGWLVLQAPFPRLFL